MLIAVLALLVVVGLFFTASASAATMPAVMQLDNDGTMDVVAGTATSYVMWFTPVQPIPKDGYVDFIFPAGYSYDANSWAGCNGSENAVVEKWSYEDGKVGWRWTVDWLRNTTTEHMTPPAYSISCGAGIVNPYTAGTTGTFIIRTYDGSGALLDQSEDLLGETLIAPSVDSNISVDIISPNGGETVPGGVADYGIWWNIITTELSNIGSVEVLLSVDGGSTYESIGSGGGAAGYFNTGSGVWGWILQI